MTQMTAAARPAKTARHVAKIRAMRKVKGAIRWHERAREQRQKLVTERHDDKRAFAEVRRWKQENVLAPIRQAKKNLKEDYEMGPLRPNRAFGPGADQYGVMSMQQLRRPIVSAESWARKNEARMAKGLEPEYPLVVDDKKYFPIAPGDRVMVMKGRELGKIGVVEEVIKDSHEVIIKDINKHYADGSVFNTPEGEEPEKKRAIEIPLSLEDIRLIIPYRMTKRTGNGKDVHSWFDVVVDNILLERHTAGRDPFTGQDHGTREIPEEHQFDPRTGLPIFNRYIAGTRTRIQWPWETKLPKEDEVARVTKANKEDSISLYGKVRHPVKFLKSKLGKGKKPAKPEQKPKTPEEIEELKLQSKLDQFNAVPTNPRGAPAGFSSRFSDDTQRHRAEPSQHTASFYPTLVYPPFPAELASEIQQHTHEAGIKERNEKQDWYEDAKEVTPEERAERKVAKAEKLRKKTVPDSMKTPLQLRWEVERRNKLAAAEKTKVDRAALLIALGQHIEATRAAKQAARSPARQEAAAELD
ncbi:hypothetical protein PMIN02_003366 [Paraphaeosphaeria minitans]|uniref:KOW domain-containing protein n=1 Tax=Paraphaeosphaeria minitans TaxID=565426 RepID=A0A9P6KTF9_9PLEO|nr:hypothetical protein PMIN01_04101 [Paraphaeosphaeria minitans]